VNPAELDAVTLDAYGTLVELDRPVERLRDALAAHGVQRPGDEVAAAFRREVAYYAEHKTEGGDAASLADLRERCARVFTQALRLDGLDFTDPFVAALVFRPLPGVPGALERLRARGLALAVVSNWDVGLHEHLRTLELGRYFATVVTSAEVGAAKPDPAVFRVALDRLGISPSRTLHVGDDGADEAGASAAGIRFAPTPLAERVGEWP
jgi:putative hydrolase of the HAD superfamily